MTEERPWTVYVCAPPKSGKNGRNFMLVAKRPPTKDYKSKSARTPDKAEAALRAEEWARELNLQARHDAGWVYFIRNSRTEAVKIGWSTDPTRRRNDLQTLCEDELVVVCLVRGAPRSAEFSIHQRLAAERLQGEWFRGPLTSRLIAGYLNRSVTWEAMDRALAQALREHLAGAS